MNQENIFAIIVIGLLLGVAGIAISASDCLKEFANVDAKDAAQILIDGYNVGDYDYKKTSERYIHFYFIENMKYQYDIAVFGSSRVLKIHNLHFPGMNLVNHGVGGGSIHDIIFCKEIYSKREKPPTFPNVAIIGPDRWTIFDGGSSQEQGGIKIIEKGGSFLNEKMDNIRLIMRESNLRILLGMNATHHATTERKGPARLIDGQIYANDVETRETRVVDEVVPTLELHHIPSISADSVQTFENYVHSLIEINVTPIFFCTPYHPIIYARHQSEKEDNPTVTSLEDLEAYVRDFAHQNEILVIGSYNPHTYNLTSADFYDDVHPRPQAISKIIIAHSHELYDLLYKDIYPTYEEYINAFAERQSELY